jgi:molybdenum cofactor cytidylyltransferase
MTKSSKSAKVGGILLAAGSSSRLGQSKQLLKVGDKTLLENSLGVLLNSKLDTVCTVLGYDAARYAKIISEMNCLKVVNPEWNSGIGSSIKFGVHSLLKSDPELQGILIAVCDQLYLSTQHIDDMISIFYQDYDQNVVSEYRGISGVPVIFSRADFNNLMTISDHMGAKALTQNNHRRPCLVPFLQGEIDIDVPDDLVHLNRQK